MIAWNFQRIVGTCQFRVPWFGYPCGYSSLTEKKGSKIIAKRKKKAYRTVYRDWYTTGIQRIDSSYHLVNEGILTRRDFNILFENDEGKKYIPVETTDSIYVYSNVILSGNFFEFINNHRG